MHDAAPRSNIHCFGLMLSILLAGCVILLCTGQPAKALITEPFSLDSLPAAKDWPMDSREFQQDPALALADLAESRFEQGRWQEALEYAEQVRAIDQEVPKARSVQVAVHALTGQRDLARQGLERLSGPGADSLYRPLIRAALTAQEGRIEEAAGILSTVAASHPEHPVALYYSGSLALAQGDLQDAEKILKGVVDDQPGFSAALAVLGQVQLRKGDLQEAARYYGQAVDKDPDNLFFRRQLIHVHEQAGHTEAMQKEQRAFLYHAPGVKDGYLQKGMALLLQGDYEQALELADKMLGIYRDIPQAFYIRAAALINLGRAEEARQPLESFVIRQRFSPMANHYAGMCHLVLGDPEKAENCFRFAVLLNPRMGISFLPLIVIEQLRGNYDGALQGLELALDHGEPPTMVNYLSAHIRLAQGDFDGYRDTMHKAADLIPGLQPGVDFVVPAEEKRKAFTLLRNQMVLFFANGWYQQCIELGRELTRQSDRDRFAWYYLSLAHAGLHQNREAASSLKALLAIDPDLIIAHASLGKLYLQDGKSTEARKALQKAVDLEPDHVPALIGLGDAWLALDNQGQAVEAYERAIVADPENASARIRMARILAEDQDLLDEALLHAQKAREIAPDNPNAMDVLGWAYVQKGDPDKALPELERAATRLSHDPAVMYHLGAAHALNKDREKAEQSLQRALQLSRDFPGADEAARLLRQKP